MQLYTKPKQLPCLHIFCIQCLNNLARASAYNGKIKCPLCQSEVAVPETGTMETLPSCFYVKNLLDILAIKECNTSKVTCGNCDTKSEEASYCFHCGKFWCKDCLNGHNILRENREHRVLALKDFQDKDFEDVLKQPVFCQNELHDKEVLKFYCKVCDVPVCQTCVIVEHNKHDVEYLEKAAKAVKNSIASKLDAAKESSNTISNRVRQLEEKSRQLQHRSKINKEEIQQTIESLILILRQKGQESIAEVEDKTMKAQEQLRKNKDEFQEQLNKRVQSISQFEALLQRSTAAELIRTKTIIDELFQALQKPQDVPSATESKRAATVFFKNQELFQTLKESRIGHLDETVTEANRCSIKRFNALLTAGLETEIEVTTRNSKGEQCYCPGDDITVELISAQDLNIANEMEVVDQKNGNYTLSFIPSAAGQHFPIVQVNGETIGETFLPVDIKERSFKPMRFIGEGSIEGTNLKKPWGVTVNDSNEIFISDMGNDRIVVLNEKGEFIRAFGQNVLNCPNGLITDKTGIIFVGSRNDNRILLFRSNGDHVSTIHSGESLKEPRGISLDSQGNLIVCDTGSECVRFISSEGNTFKTIGKGSLRMPFDCVCFDGKIFVSDRDAHLIKVYNSNGELLYEFGRYGTGDGEFDRPTGLAVDKTGHLLVCSTGNHRVQVFTLDGKFVTKFGACGKKLGQLERPTSLSVLKSGHLVICELDNCRLQVFE